MAKVWTCIWSCQSTMLSTNQCDRFPGWLLPSSAWSNTPLKTQDIPQLTKQTTLTIHFFSIFSVVSIIFPLAVWSILRIWIRIWSGSGLNHIRHTEHDQKQKKPSKLKKRFETWAWHFECHLVFTVLSRRNPLQDLAWQAATHWNSLIWTRPV